MEQDTIITKEEKAHARIKILFDDIKILSKVETEEARSLMMLTLDLIKREYNQIKRR